jgi:Cu/Ag efflux pump CusA
LLPIVISVIGGLVAASIAILFLAPAILAVAEAVRGRFTHRRTATEALA